VAGVTAAAAHPAGVAVTHVLTAAALAAGFAALAAANTFTAGPQTVQTGADANKGLVVKANSGSQTGNLAECQDSGGTPYVTVGPPVLPGNSSTVNVLNVTATLPAGNTASAFGVNFVLTSSGSSAFSQAAVVSQLSAGYTGSATTFGHFGLNLCAGTGSRLTTSGSSPTGNLGNSGAAQGSTAGANVGTSGTARNSTSFNVGVHGQANSATSGAVNVGVFGNAINASGTPCGGFFSLYATNLNPSIPAAALCADNGATSSPIFLARINGSTTFTIDAVGNVVLAPAALSTSATDGFTYLPTCAGTPTGTPTAKTGTVAAVYDTTNNKLYVYNGAWKSVTLA
jgi:hypothetical protein